MKKLRITIVLLLMTFMLMTQAQTASELPKTLFPANPAVLPLIKSVNAKFPECLSYTRGKQVCYYYIGMIDTTLTKKITNEDISKWTDMLNQLPAKSKSVNDNKDNRNRIISYQVNLQSHHQTDELKFILVPRLGYLELSYNCRNRETNEFSEEYIYPEEVRLCLDEGIQHIINHRVTEVFDYAVWGKKQRNLTFHQLNNDDNLSTGRHYVVHGCTEKDFDDFIHLLEKTTKYEDFSYTISHMGNRHRMFSVGMLGEDHHWQTYCGLLIDSEFHLLQIGGTSPMGFEIPADWYKDTDNAVRVDTTTEQQPERVYDASTVNTLPVWRIHDQNTWRQYLKNNGLRTCTPTNNEDCVVVMFIIRKDGSITDSKVMLNRSKQTELADQAIRTIEKMPKWTPAMVDGLPVDCRFVVRLTK